MDIPSAAVLLVTLAGAVMTVQGGAVAILWRALEKERKYRALEAKEFRDYLRRADKISPDPGWRDTP